MLGHYPLWHELTSRVVAGAGINMHLHTQSHWLQGNTERNMPSNVEQCESASRHITEVNPDRSISASTCVCFYGCICSLYVCVWGLGLGVCGMLYSLRHHRGEPSIYQLQLNTAPSFLPEGTVRHILVSSTSPSQRSDIKTPCWAAALKKHAVNRRWLEHTLLQLQHINM